MLTMMEDLRCLFMYAGIVLPVSLGKRKAFVPETIDEITFRQFLLLNFLLII